MSSQKAQEHFKQVIERNIKEDREAIPVNRHKKLDRIIKKLEEEVKSAPLPIIKENDGTSYELAISIEWPEHMNDILTLLGYNFLNNNPIFDESSCKAYEIFTGINRLGTKRLFYFNMTPYLEKYAKVAKMDLKKAGKRFGGNKFLKMNVDPDIMTKFKSTIRSCAKCLKTDECQDVKFKCCSGCKQIYYCSSACQKQHWKQIHKKECLTNKV